MAEGGRGNFSAALSCAEFRAMWAAEALSVVGDQLARVALALVVFDRTSSASLTALTYALTFAPSVLGGFLLSGLADRYARRAVIVSTDVVRGGLAIAMALPGLPLPAMWCLVGVLTLAGAPFKGAQLALLPDVLPADLLQAGLGLRQVTMQIAQAAGFGLGGLLVPLLGAGPVLAINGGTFLLSAAIVLVGVRPRPAARHAPAAERSAAPAIANPRYAGQLAAPVILISMIGLLEVPEGIAAPFAKTAGAASFAVGLLMAANPVGSAIGGWWAGRSRLVASPFAVLVPAIAAGLPLMAAMVPSLPVAALSWAVSGALSTCYLVRLQPVVLAIVPDNRRGTVMGRLSTCIITSQGLAIVVAGVVADRIGPAPTVAVSGALASAVALGAAFVWTRTRPRQDRAAVDESEPPGRRRSPVFVAHASPPGVSGGGKDRS